MNVVAVTACPTGIAHSQMAAENLENAGEAMGHEVHVEVQGAMGTENEISGELIASADAVIVAADTTVRTDRFGDVPLVKGTVKDAVNDAEALVREAEEKAGAGDEAAGEESDHAADEGADAAADETPGGEASEEVPAGETPGAESTGGGETDDEAAVTGGTSRSSGRGDEREGLVGKIKSLFS